MVCMLDGVLVCGSAAINSPGTSPPLSGETQLQKVHKYTIILAKFSQYHINVKYGHFWTASFLHFADFWISLL